MTKLQTLTLQRIDQKIADRHLLKHPFYQTWSAGKLTREALQGYAGQYYKQVESFPLYLAGVYAHCPNVERRREILENLIEEDRGADNHLDLWLRFAEGIGVKREEVFAATALPETEHAVSQFKKLTIQGRLAEGMAALYAYESMVPEVAEQKITGLKAFYGIDDARTLSFFAVHEQVDREHRQINRRLLSDFVVNESSAWEAETATDTAIDAMWKLLDGVQRVYVGNSMPGCN